MKNDDRTELEVFKSIWKRSPMVVLDTNILLEMYRCSPTMSDAMIELYTGIIENVWLPNQVWVEYTNNKRTVINEANNKYLHLQKNINQVIKQSRYAIESKFALCDKRNFPKTKEVKNQLLEKISEMEQAVDEYKNQIQKEVDDNKQYLKKDRVSSVLISQLVYKKRVGQEYSLDQLLKIYEEGDIRFKHLIPPGFKDIEKDKKDNSKTKKYGDLIVWKQMIDKANEDNVDVVMIVNDEKSDWFEEDEFKKKKSPHPLLMKEFKQSTNHEIMILNVYDFLKLYSELKKVNKNFIICINPTSVFKEFLDRIPIGIELYERICTAIDDYVRDECYELGWENFLRVDECNYELEGIEILEVSIDEINEREVKFIVNMVAEVSASCYADYSDPGDSVNDSFRHYYVGDVCAKYKYSFSVKCYIGSNESENIIEGYNDFKEIMIALLEDSVKSGVEKCAICQSKIGEYRYEKGYLCEECREKFIYCNECGTYYHSEKYMHNEKMCTSCYIKKTKKEENKVMDKYKFPLLFVNELSN